MIPSKRHIKNLFRGGKLARIFQTSFVSAAPSSAAARHLIDVPAYDAAGVCKRSDSVLSASLPALCGERAREIGSKAVFEVMFGSHLTPDFENVRRHDFWILISIVAAAMAEKTRLAEKVVHLISLILRDSQFGERQIEPSGMSMKGVQVYDHNQQIAAAWIRLAVRY